MGLDYFSPQCNLLEISMVVPVQITRIAFPPIVAVSYTNNSKLYVIFLSQGAAGSNSNYPKFVASIWWNWCVHCIWGDCFFLGQKLFFISVNTVANAISRLIECNSLRRRFPFRVQSVGWRVSLLVCSRAMYFTYDLVWIELTKG